MANAKRQRKKEGHRARLEAARAAARREQRKRRAIGIVIAAAAIIGVLALISAVGGDDSDDSDEAGSTTTTTEPTTTTTLDITKPEVGIPDEPPPTELRIDDVTAGDGPEAKLGDTIEVHYVGVSYADGTEFDSSWDKGAPAEFELVEGGLIKGWTDGIPGMKVGGRRRLIVPGPLAYGDEDTGDGRPHGTLVFVVDLISIK